MEIMHNGQKFEKKKEFNFKKGKFPVFANIALLIIFVIGAIIGLQFFSFDIKNIETVIALFLFVIYMFVYLLINLFIQFIFYKAAKGGQIKFHFGLLLEIYHENPISITSYFAAQVASTLIPVVVNIVLLIIFWNIELFFLFVFVFGSFICYFPLYIFLQKQQNNSIVKMEDGILNIFTME